MYIKVNYWSVFQVLWQDAVTNQLKSKLDLCCSWFLTDNWLCGTQVDWICVNGKKIRPKEALELKTERFSSAWFWIWRFASDDLCQSRAAVLRSKFNCGAVEASQRRPQRAACVQKSLETPWRFWGCHQKIHHPLRNLRTPRKTEDVLETPSWKPPENLLETTWTPPPSQTTSWRSPNENLL